MTVFLGWKQKTSTSGLGSNSVKIWNFNKNMKKGKMKIRADSIYLVATEICHQVEIWKQFIMKL